MRLAHVALLAVTALVPVSSLAQEPDVAPAAVEVLPEDAEAAPDGVIDVGDQVYALDETPSTRFPDADDAGPTMHKDSRLVVLVVDGDRLRVMASIDESFGWIPASSVTLERPAPDLDALTRDLREQLEGGGMGL